MLVIYEFLRIDYDIIIGIMTNNTYIITKIITLWN